MNKYLLIGIIVIIAGLVIVTAISRPLWIGIPLIGVWIYLLWMVWKKKTKIFPDQIEPKLAESRYRMMKVFLLVAGISLAVGIVGVIMHNVLYAQSGEEEAVFFFIGLLGLFVFIIATIIVLVVFLIGRRKTTKKDTEISSN